MPLPGLSAQKLDTVLHPSEDTLMTTSVDVPTQLFSEIQLRAAQQGEPLHAVVADLLRKGLAASNTQGVAAPNAAELLQRRQEIAEKFISGEWSTDLEGFEAGRIADREAAQRRDELWSQ